MYRSFSEYSPEQRTRIAKLLQQADIVLPQTRALEPKESNCAPLSYAQERMLFLQEFEPDKVLYNLPLVLRLKGRLRLVCLQTALNEILRRHKILRTSFTDTDIGKNPVQVINPAAPLEIRKIGAPSAEDGQQLYRLILEEIQKPFDLKRSPLVRAALIEVSATDHVLIITMHHIVSDGWSIAIFARELQELYGALSQGRDPSLLELPIQYADYAIWHREWMQEEKLATYLSYWKERLQAIPDHWHIGSQPEIRQRDSAGEQQEFYFRPERIDALREMSRREGVTLFMVLLTVLKILLLRYSGQEDIIVGTPVAGRSRIELEGLIGLFVNTVVLRTDMSNNPDFLHLLQRVRETALGAYAHQEMPFEKLVEVLQPERSLSKPPLFQVMAAFQNTPPAQWNLFDLTVTEEQVDLGKEKVGLTVAFVESNRDFKAIFSYRKDFLEKNTVSRMVQHFGNLFREILLCPTQKITDLPLLSLEQRQRVLEEWNRTETAFSHKAVHELFEYQAEQTPASMAVKYGDEKLSYQDLNSRANQLARHLLRSGVKQEAPVGIYMKASPEMIIAVLAILKAGAAYVPLDTAYPVERLKFMLEDARIRTLLTDGPLPEGMRQAGGDATCIQISQDWERIARQSRQNLELKVDGKNLAYAMYTSGSTGTPKGILVVHEAITRLVQNTNYVNLGTEDRVAQIANTSFDAATFEIWGALLNGGCLVGINKAAALSPQMLAGHIREESITAMFLTASLFNHTAKEAPDAFVTMRFLIFGGEAADPDCVRRVLKAGKPQFLLNGYGPTENTTFTCWYSVTDQEWPTRSVPLGRPIANTQVYVLDRNLNPVPVGVAGELYIAGEGLARGYLRRPDFTAERFIPNPFAKQEGERLYRSGDRVRYMEDGILEFLGRWDRQVKLRGFRIELGEIEAVLRDYPGVEDVAVLLQEDESKEKRLAAYVVTKETRKLVGNLQEYAYQKLPEHMVPSVFAFLEQFPLNANGKLDMEALQALQGEAPEIGLPRTPLEEIMCSVFADILGVKQIGINSNFFHCGGHSLLVMKLAGRASQLFRLHVSIETIFKYPTVKTLVEALNQMALNSETSSVEMIEPAPRDGILPISINQESRLLKEWWTSVRSIKARPFPVADVFSFSREVNVGAIQYALNRIIDRHEILRTTFTHPERIQISQLPTSISAPLSRMQEKESARQEEVKQALKQYLSAGSLFKQTIHPAFPLTLQILDFTDLEPSRRKAEFWKAAATAFETPFDYETLPLMRAILVKLELCETLLIIAMPHILCDGWSFDIFRRELQAFYDGFESGNVPSLSTPLQSADFAYWERKQLQAGFFDRKLAYWEKKWADFELLNITELPFARPMPSSPVEIAEVQCVMADSRLHEEIISFTRNCGITLYMLFLAGLYLILSAFTGRDRIGIWGIFANRTVAQTEHLVSWLATGHLLGIEINPRWKVSHLVQHVRTVVLEAHSNQEVPMLLLWPSMRSNWASHMTFVLEQNIEKTPNPQGGVVIGRGEMPANTGGLGLRLVLVPAPGELRLIAQYGNDIFDKPGMEYFLSAFCDVIKQLIAGPELEIAEVVRLCLTGYGGRTNV